MEKDKNTVSQPDDFDVDIQACSTMDCTGLIPALPKQRRKKKLMRTYILTSRMRRTARMTNKDPESRNPRKAFRALFGGFDSSVLYKNGFYTPE